MSTEGAWWWAPAVWTLALMLVGVLLLSGWRRFLPAMGMALGSAAVGVAAAAAVAATTGLLAVAWVVGVVAWGNALWLAPESRWGERPLDDAPAPPR